MKEDAKLLVLSIKYIYIYIYIYRKKSSRDTFFHDITILEDDWMRRINSF